MWCGGCRYRGYAYTPAPTGMGAGFALIVVLFILLIIVGAVCWA
ncbi:MULTISPECIES: YjcZ family sporulation protein [Heyndrickxia]|nr:YjcZ family sporulation protein [Heyndrickxia shackletonii]